MTRTKITIAVTGLNNTDNPGPGVPVIRALRDSKEFDVRIIGLAYENLEPGIYMHDIVDKTYRIPYPSEGSDILIKRVLEINTRDKIDLLIPNFDAELLAFMKARDILLNAGIHVSGGSDAPVTYPDPIEGIYGACNHPYDPDESVSIVDALKMYTGEVAWTTFDDKDRGSLETGKIADLVIMNQDPLSMTPENLRSLKVEKLFLSGKEYQSGMGVMGMLWNGLTGRKEKI